MRGYATVIAAIVLFVVLASALSVLLAQNLRVSERLSQAKQFVNYAEKQSESSVLRLISFDWNKDANVLTLVFQNGPVSVDLNTISIFVDGIYVGGCADLSCVEATPDGKLLPGEELNVHVPVSYLPYRISASAGPYGVTSVSAELNNWHSGCRYRRLVFIKNPSSSALSSFQVLVRLDPSFDYSKADSTSVLVTGPDGFTEIPFWVEYWDVNGYSNIWIRTSVPADDSNYVYVYYGCSSTPTYSPSDVFLDDIPDLVAYWPLDENSGSVAHDLSGNSYELNIFGAKWVSGWRGTALYLDGGTDSYLIRNPFSGFPSSQITAYFWMKTNDTSNHGVPISYASTATPDDFAVMNYQDLRVYVAGKYKIPGLALNDGAWHGIAVTWKSAGGDVNVYDNGASVYSNISLSDGNMITDGGALVIGQDQDSVGGGFDSSQAYIGTIDEIMIFCRVLTAQQISEIYDENYFTSDYYPGHLLVRKNDPGVVVDVRAEEAYSKGSNK